MRRRLRKVEPPRPSTRRRILQGDVLTTTATAHGTDAPKLLSLIRGDLDWIVMKCLEKDRVRLALELPKSGQRRDELRAEFTQGLGDPLGAEPVEVVWEPALTANDFVRMSLNPDGEWAAVWRLGHSLAIRETRMSKSVADLTDLVLPVRGVGVRVFNPVFSTDGHALYGVVHVAEKDAGPDAYVVGEWRRNPDGSWARRQRPSQPIFAVLGTREDVFAVQPAADKTFQVLNLETGRSLGTFSPPPKEIRPWLAAALAPKRGWIALGTSPGGCGFSPDACRLAVTRENGDISIWNLPEVEAAIAQAGLAP